MNQQKTTGDINTGKPPEKKSKVNIILFIIIVVVAFVVIGLVFGIGINGKSKAKNSPSPVESSPNSQYQAMEGPLEKVFTNAPVPNVSTTTVSMSPDGKNFTTSDGAILTVPVDGDQSGLRSFTSANPPCSVSTESDFCLAATTVDGSGKEMNMFFFKDIVHSRFFDNATNDKIMTDGTIRGSMTISLNGKVTPVYVYAFDNSSGIMLTAVDGSPIEEPHVDIHVDNLKGAVKH